MSHPNDHTEPPGDPLSALESALGALQPASRLDRDRTLFRAGQATARQPAQHWRHAWPALAASLALIALGQSVLLARRPAHETQFVYVPAPSAPTPTLPTPNDAPTALAQTPPVRSPSPPPRRWLDEPGPTPADRLRWQLIRYGLDVLPATPVAAVAPSEPLTAGQRDEIVIRTLLNPGGPS
jgi:hypothetical protein